MLVYEDLSRNEYLDLLHTMGERWEHENPIPINWEHGNRDPMAYSYKVVVI